MIDHSFRETSPPVVVSFYAVREDDLSSLRTPEREELVKILGAPLERFQDRGYYLGTLLGYMEEHHHLQLEPPQYADILMDLVEFHGGGWTLIDRTRATSDALDPDQVLVSQLQAHYARMAREAGDAMGQSQWDDAGEGIIQALASLRTALRQVQPGHVLLVHD
jgi:hypothetical protein